jgi:hypothetical protein
MAQLWTTPIVGELPTPPRRRLLLARLATVGVLVVALVIAQPLVSWAAAGGIAEVRSFATRLTAYVTTIAASVAVLFIAINGLRWTMSSGNPLRQAEARHGLVSAAAGLAIALSANVLVSLVTSALQ